MSCRDWIVGIIFLSQTTVGIVDNFSLLYHYLFLYHAAFRVRSTHLILKHLTIANSLVILSKGVPHTMASFGLKHFFSEFECKLLLCVQRVGRGMSIGSICLLSVFQTITISPMDSCWKDLKTKAPKYVGFSIYLCWIQLRFVNLVFPLLYVSSNWNMKNFTKKGDLGYCLAIEQDTITISVYAVLIVFPEASCCVLTIRTSGCMVFILQRHRQRVQHIHSTSVSPRSSAESRATQSILVLVSTFVSLYSLSSIFHVSVVLIYNPSRWLVNTAAVISVCFPTVCPFLLRGQNFAIPRCSFAWITNIKFPNLFRNV